VRQLIKGQVERALSSRAVGRMVRHRVRGKRLILAYHGVVPEGEAPAGERTLFIGQREFAAHLDMLAEVADVSPLAAIDQTGDGRPRVAITFDDAYRGAAVEGVRELAKRNLPATIFVAPGRLNHHVFWWDALANESRILHDKVREHALRALGGCDERVRAWAASADLPVSDTLPPYAQTATVAELRVAVATAGITVGSHSWSHANLASLAADDVALELNRSRDWLRAEFGEKAIEWVAYPYGLDSAEVRELAARASFTGGLRIGGGWHGAADTFFLARPRLSIPGTLSVAGLRARLLGAKSP
jgi:peptidoglycan/xylan/chitin deacetylase (PgdA/CDA1 family)